ncbi:MULTISPECIES: hypothetical protein [unclassified Rhodococcus (in: high G+C Gram-positive bacteria)]|uniref:hypothetical protein n=1 Tax=unclassified Rhodococcus (in: high G+C Gram-positive bacteria) TaxID=192944 RepID=UPI00036C2ADB|nr:hypothetical protein [Rhodococcus sp. DK17]
MLKTRVFAQVVNQAFRVFLLAFLAGGFVLVFGQVLGIIVGQGSILVDLEEALAIPTYMCAAIAGLLAFAEMYASGRNVKEEG